MSVSDPDISSNGKGTQPIKHGPAQGFLTLGSIVTIKIMPQMTVMGGQKRKPFKVSFHYHPESRLLLSALLTVKSDIEDTDLVHIIHQDTGLRTAFYSQPFIKDSVTQCWSFWGYIFSKANSDAIDLIIDDLPPELLKQIYVRKKRSHYKGVVSLSEIKQGPISFQHVSRHISNDLRPICVLTLLSKTARNVIIASGPQLPKAQLLELGLQELAMLRSATLENPFSYIAAFPYNKYGSTTIHDIPTDEKEVELNKDHNMYKWITQSKVESTLSKQYYCTILEQSFFPTVAEVIEKFLMSHSNEFEFKNGLVSYNYDPDAPLGILSKETVDVIKKFANLYINFADLPRLLNVQTNCPISVVHNLIDETCRICDNLHTEHSVNLKFKGKDFVVEKTYICKDPSCFYNTEAVQLRIYASDHDSKDLDQFDKYYTDLRALLLTENIGASIIPPDEDDYTYWFSLRPAIYMPTLLKDHKCVVMEFSPPFMLKRKNTRIEFPGWMSTIFKAISRYFRYKINSRMFCSRNPNDEFNYYDFSLMSKTIKVSRSENVNLVKYLGIYYSLPLVKFDNIIQFLLLSDVLPWKSRNSLIIAIRMKILDVLDELTLVSEMQKIFSKLVTQFVSNKRIDYIPPVYASHNITMNILRKEYVTSDSLKNLLVKKES